MEFSLPDELHIQDGSVRTRYVAFCDVLGFSNAVVSDFAAASKVYVDFVNSVRRMGAVVPAEVTVYSDSILVASDELAPVLTTVQMLWWSALGNDWLIRGGVAHGRVWEHRENGHLFVVSEPLVRATHIEKTVRVPCVEIAPDIPIGDDLWLGRFAHGPLSTPLLHFSGRNIVNPFNRYWFQSAFTRVSQLLEASPQHSDKYYWFLALADQVNSDAPLVPPTVLASFKEQGLVRFVEYGEDSPEA